MDIQHNQLPQKVTCLHFQININCNGMNMDCIPFFNPFSIPSKQYFKFFSNAASAMCVLNAQISNEIFKMRRSFFGFFSVKTWFVCGCFSSCTCSLLVCASFRQELSKMRKIKCDLSKTKKTRLAQLPNYFRKCRCEAVFYYDYTPAPSEIVWQLS